jgi:hypothetical protein
MSARIKFAPFTTKSGSLKRAQLTELKRMKSIAIASLMGASAVINLTVGNPVVSQAHVAERTAPTPAEVHKVVSASLEQMVPFASKDNKVKLKYPKNWEEMEPTGSPIFWKIRALGGLASARIATEQIPTGTSLESYANATKAAVQEQMTKQQMPVTVVEDQVIKIAGQPAMQTDYTYELAGTKETVEVLQVVFVQGQNGYVFNFTAQHEMFDDFMPVVSAILNSIEVEH